MEDLKIFEDVSVGDDANLVAGQVVNRVEVDPETARLARLALDRMLAVR